MVREFKLPDVGEGVHEGELVQWLVNEGDAVSEDQPVAKVETDKALVDVPAPVDGTVRELRWSEGDVVPVGEVLLTFDVEGEVDAEEIEPEVEPVGGEGADGDGASGTATDSAGDAGRGAGERETGAASGDEAAAEAADETVADREPAAGEATSAGSDGSGSGGRVFAAPSVRRLARELAVEVEDVAGSGPGGRITEDDVYAAAEDAIDVDDGDGAAESGDDAEAGVGGRDEAAGGGPSTGDRSAAGGDASAAATGAAGSTGEAPGASAGQAAEPGRGAAAERERTLAAPATRRLARELGVDLDAVPAVGERDGEPFVTEDAVREYAGAQQRAQAADADAVSTGASAGAGAAGERAAPTGANASAAGESAAPGEKPERREPYRGVRRTIGEAMARSKYTAPHVTHTDEVDVTRLVEAKERLAERAEERGIRLTYVPFVLKAVVGALQEYPLMNSQLDEDAEEIVLKEYYDLGVATATDAGLMVPVVEGVDRKGLLQIASELNELVEQARNRTIAPEDLRGSTFTVTNVGAIGGEYATPIVNHPEAAILALGQIRRKPRVVEDDSGQESIEPRSILPLSLSFDHRVIDGAIGAQFTNAVRERLRDPELLLLE